VRVSRFVAPDGSIVQRKLRELQRRARTLQGFTWALRFAGGGLVVSFPFLLFRNLLSFRFPPFSLLVLGALGALYGVSRPLSRFQVAKLADARLGLKERLATAVEVLEKGEDGEVVTALLRDAAKTAQRISAKEVFPFRPLKEGGFLLLLALVFFLLPPLPFQPGMGERGTREISALRKEIERLKEERTPETLDRREGSDLPESPSSPKGSSSKREPWGDLPARFKDTKLDQERMGFQGFLQEADERLKRLANANPFPSPSTASANPSPLAAPQGGGSPPGRPQTLPKPPESLQDGVGRLFQEIKELSQKLGPSGRDLGKSQEARQEASRSREGKDPAGGTSKRPQEGGERLSKGLQGLPEQAPASQEEKAEDRGRGSGREGDPSPGRGEVPGEKGEPTPRMPERPSLKIDEPKRKLDLSGPRQEPGVESFETELLGEGAQVPSRLSYLNLLSQYRRMMEEEIGREAIPFDYREQVKRYFLSLEEAVRKRQDSKGGRK